MSAVARCSWRPDAKNGRAGSFSAVPGERGRTWLFDRTVAVPRIRRRVHLSSRVGRTAARGCRRRTVAALGRGCRSPTPANGASWRSSAGDREFRDDASRRTGNGETCVPIRPGGSRAGRTTTAERAGSGAAARGYRRDRASEARVSGLIAAVPPTADDASRVRGAPSFASLDGARAVARRCYAARRVVAVTRCAPARHGRGAAFQTGSKSMIDGTRSRCFDRFRGVGGAGSAECEAVCR